MNFVFVQEADGVTRVTLERGNNIYQALIADKDFESSFVERIDLSKCFQQGGIVDENTSATFSVNESPDSLSVRVDLCIIFQKSKRTQARREEFCFDFIRIDQDQQLALVKKLSAENKALNQRISDLEAQIATIGMASFGYYDYEFETKVISDERINTTVAGNCSINSYQFHQLVDGLTEYRTSIYLSGEMGKYILEHPRFQTFRSLFWKENASADYFGMKYEWVSRRTTGNGTTDQTNSKCSHYGMSQEEIEVYDTLQYGVDYYCFSRNQDERNYKKYKTILKLFQTDYDSLIKKFKHIEMTAIAKDLRSEYILRGKLLLAPNAVGRCIVIQHPTDPLAVTHTFDLLHYLRNPPTAKDCLFFSPQYGFYKSHV